MNDFIALIGRMAPYLLLGFFLAGVLHVYLPATWSARHLGRQGFRSVLFAALLGIPLPLCSCGVIPTAMSLRHEGASKGATVSFLIATPQTGIDSIIATYSLMGLPFAIVRPIAALLTALFGGMLVDTSDRMDTAKNGGTATCSCNREQNASAADAPRRTVAQGIREVFRYAYVEMMQDIGKALVIGMIVAGLITVLVPTSFFVYFQDNTLLSILLVLLFSIPMYICATGSIPIAVAFMLKGLSPGAALVLLMAGPAANAASMMVVSKVLGRKTMLLYVLSIVLGATLCALGIDYLLPREWFISTLTAINKSGAGLSWFNAGCMVILFILLLNALLQRYLHREAAPAMPAETTAKAETAETAALSALTFHVEGMNCNHCKASAERAILSVSGVKSAEVVLATGEAHVEGDNLSVDELRTAIESIGFTFKP